MLSPLVDDRMTFVRRARQSGCTLLFSWKNVLGAQLASLRTMNQQRSEPVMLETPASQASMAAKPGRKAFDAHTFRASERSRASYWAGKRAGCLTTRRHGTMCWTMHISRLRKFFCFFGAPVRAVTGHQETPMDHRKAASARFLRPNPGTSVGPLRNSIRSAFSLHNILVCKWTQVAFP